MYCDYDALQSETDSMGQKFNEIITTLDSIDNCFKNIKSVGVWDSPTRDFLENAYNSFKDNFGNINDKFNNAKEYLENVVENYRRMDS